MSAREPIRTTLNAWQLLRICQKVITEACDNFLRHELNLNRAFTRET